MVEIIEEVRKFVEKECEKPTSRYGKEPYDFHFIPMRNYVVRLAEKLGADVEIVEIAAWLHDIGSITNGRENHHITGAEIAEQKLRELGYSQDKIEKIKHCILSHRSSSSTKPESLEAKIVSDADALSCFDSLPGNFKAAFVYENQIQGEARESVRRKLERKWNKLYLEESRKLIKPKYEAVMLLLK